MLTSAILLNYRNARHLPDIVFISFFSAGAAHATLHECELKWVLLMGPDQAPRPFGRFDNHTNFCTTDYLDSSIGNHGQTLHLVVKVEMCTNSSARPLNLQPLFSISKVQRSNSFRLRNSSHCQQIAISAIAPPIKERTRICLASWRDMLMPGDIGQRMVFR